MLSRLLGFCSQNLGYFESPNSELVRLYGNSNISVFPVFFNHMELLAGVLPTDDNQGAIIDTVLATANDIVVGDSITVYLEETSIELSIPVIGIYKTISDIQESWIDDSGMIAYGDSHYSYIFCNYFYYQDIKIFNEEDGFVVIYTKNAKALNNVYSKLESMVTPTGEYSITNRVESEYSIGASYSAIKRIAGLLTIVSLCVTLLVLFVVLLLWIRSCYSDIAILISMGMTRVKIAVQYLFVVTVVAGSALLLSLPCCMLLIKHFGKDMLEYVYLITDGGNKPGVSDYMNMALDSELYISDYLSSNALYLLVVWVSMLFSSIKIAICNPSVLFYNE